MLAVTLIIYSFYWATAKTTCETIQEKLVQQKVPLILEEFEKLQIQPNEAQINLVVTNIVLNSVKVDPPTIDKCEPVKHVPCQIKCFASAKAELEFSAFSYKYKAIMKGQNVEAFVHFSRKGHPTGLNLTFSPNPEDLVFEIEDSWIFNQIAQYVHYILDYVKPHAEHEIFKFLKKVYRKPKTEL